MKKEAKQCGGNGSGDFLRRIVHWKAAARKKAMMERQSKAVELALKQASSRKIAKLLKVSHQTVITDLKEAKKRMPAGMARELDLLKPTPFRAGKNEVDRAHVLNALFDRRMAERRSAEAGQDPKTEQKLPHRAVSQLKASVSDKTARYLFSRRRKPLLSLSPEMEAFRTRHVLPKMLKHLNAIAHERALRPDFIEEMRTVIALESIRITPKIRPSSDPKDPLRGAKRFLYKTVEYNINKQIERLVREKAGLRWKEVKLLPKLLRFERQGSSIREMSEMLGIPEEEARAILLAYHQSKTVPLGSKEESG